MKLDIKNFRSIKDQSVELAPITVLYGPNGSGKSSLLYSLLVMKNVILKLEKYSGDFYDLDFVDLGDFRAVVHNHQVHDYILFEISITSSGYPVRWRVVLHNESVEVSLLILDQTNSTAFNPTMRASSPYKIQVTYHGDIKFNGAEVEFQWEGTRAQSHPNQQDNPEALANAKLLNDLANEPVEIVRSIATAPLQMAFSKGAHSVATAGSSLNSMLFFSEDAVGTLLATRRYLQSPVSKYLEEITNRTLRVFSPPGDPNFSINVADQDTGLETELVNDGYGVNRTAWLLALALHDETRWMCIEEPETHLHPTSIRKLVKTFVEIMHNEDKRFLFTTHSEVFALAILSEVARGNLKPDDVTFYLTTKEGKETNFERQKINVHGQIEGGLTSFMEGELEDLAVLYGETD